MRICALNNLKYGVNLRSLIQSPTNTELKQVSKNQRAGHFI
jgi:hypothetical protein